MLHEPRVTDVNQLFSRAEAAFGAGRLADARTLASQVLREAGDHPAVLHLLALVEKRAGDHQLAKSAFLRALQLAPGDPQINNNYANLLDELGRPDDALAHYDRALAANPGFTDARLNRGMLLQTLGRHVEALREFDRVIAVQPGRVATHSARGAVLRALERFPEAAAAYDAALRLAPGHVKALNGRARVALESGEAGVADRYRRALAISQDDDDMVIGFAEALEAEGNPDAFAVLEGAVETAPDWIEGQDRLAQMRAEAGDREGFARGFTTALAQRPTDRGLHHAYWQALARAGQYREGLDAIAAARALFVGDRDTALMESVFLSEAGETARAADLLARLGDGPDVTLASARNLLRGGDHRQAVERLEHFLEGDPANITAWAHLGLAWRVVGDPRHAWLCEQPGLYRPIELGLDDGELALLADVLRGLHKTRAHPIGQSLRGGTQTRGRLFWRSEPEIVALRQAIETAIACYVADLPPHDDSHPLLRHRSGSFGIAGSWSVRLSQTGFHVNHIHPQGVLSSACYVALPPTLGGAGGQDGWLELGAPPAELGLGLPPLAVIEPQPGRLALFPSYLYHGTLPFSAGERLTVAFDVAPG